MRMKQMGDKNKEWRKRNREKTKAARNERQTARKAELDALTADERAEFEAKEFEQRGLKTVERRQRNAKIDDALATGQRVAIDLSYSESMTAKEQASLASQLARCWGINRRASHPVSLSLTGLSKCPIEEWKAGGGQLADAGNWKVHLVEEDVSVAFPKEELVLLSPDAEEPLLELDPTKVYVIGGLVDTSVKIKTSLAKATELKVKAMRLPLAENAAMANAREPLTLPAVLEILLSVNAGDNWETAIGGAVAPRLMRDPHANGRSKRRQSAKWCLPRLPQTLTENERRQK